MFVHKLIISALLLSLEYLLSKSGIILSPLLKDKKEKRRDESFTFIREAQSAVPLRLRRLISLFPLFSQAGVSINLP
jgi:hypothetical protein